MLKRKKNNKDPNKAFPSGLKMKVERLTRL